MANSLNQTGGFMSTDSETLGFDLSSGKKWIYPENYPRRDYQFSIVQTALYNNTLVCLPTGLGKTFIAAVVMYNFWRWYPRGKVVFLAPTKPLVAQQIHACHDIMGIPSDQTIELTGAIVQAKRKQAWMQKRVIFATPQTFQKDLQNEYVPFDLVKCVVIDEAHKALGKHSYCEIVRMLNSKSKFFRILALSATPGSKIDHVREVIQNLLISELELRDDDSPDIVPYTNSRSMEKIIVKLGQDLKGYKDRYICIMDPHVRVLIQNHILQGSTANISKGRIFMLMKQYESRPQKANNHGVIMKTLNILLTMYHAYELLVKHGLRAFYNFYLTHSDKFWIDSEQELQVLLNDIKNYIGDFPVIEPLPDGTIPDVPNDIIFGHDKFFKLRELLEQHFRTFAGQNKSTRAIVFVEYRDIVNEVYVLLLQKRPLIRPQMFVGQAGQKRKQQLAALEDFRNNQVNVLISTSVGEEGLDVGEVDLIVCFDISTSTPTRLVQRMGRTGRKRNGRVVLLLTEGKEVQTLDQAMSKKDSLNSKILQSSNIASSLYQSSPRMVPTDFTPECMSMFIKALPKTPKGAAKAIAAAEKEKEKKSRKPRKKKDELEEQPVAMQASSTKTFFSPKKGGGSTQSSMMRFLTDQRRPQSLQAQPQQHRQQPRITNFADSDSGIYEEFAINREPNDGSVYSNLRPGDVKLLTSDSLALDFLTLCAMKRSEPQPEASNFLKADAEWLMSPCPDDNPFAELELPPNDCLECISRLTLCERPRPDCSFEESLREMLDEADEDERPVGCEVLDSQDFAADEFYSPIGEAFDFEFEQEGRAVLGEDGCIEVVQSKYANTERKSKDEDMDKLNNISASESTSILNTSAHVEVNFEALLDEGTESDASELQAVPEPIPCSMFDALLDEEDESSADEDLFGDLSQPSLADETLKPEAAPRKRSASLSPRHDSPVKRQRLDAEVDSSDGEAVAILGTPPVKPARAKSFLNSSVFKTSPEISASTPTAPKVVYPDSDEDIFQDLDLDFETQFSPNVTLVEQTEEVSIAKNQQQQQLEETKDEVVSSEAPVIEAKLESPKNEEEGNKDESSGADVTKAEEEKSVDEEKQPVAANHSAHVVEDIFVEDWDDFDLAPMVLSKEKTAQETVSSFFKTPLPRTTDTKSQSSGWITTSEKSQPQQPKKALSLKNLNVRSKEQQQSNDTSSDKKPNSHTSYDVFRAEPASRPSLRLSSLKRSDEPKPTIPNKDKDGFALPRPRPNGPSEKENKAPWHSPGLRRYHSESSLDTSRKCSKRKKRKKSRKRLANGFIEDEAEVSSDCETSEGSSGSEGDAQELDSFVSYTQVVDEEVDMRAHYLQTLNKSPVRAGAFMIKRSENGHKPNWDVYSQPMSQVNDTYVHDSFCVGDETQMAIENDSNSSSNDSLLGSLESALESRRKKLKKKRESKFKDFKFKSSRNRNIIHKDSSSGNSDDGADNSSSEDETEVLRRQVLEESMLLKKSKN